MQGGETQGGFSDEKPSAMTIDQNGNLFVNGYFEYTSGPTFRYFTFGNYSSIEKGSFLYKVLPPQVNGIAAANQPKLVVSPNPNNGRFLLELQQVPEAQVLVLLRNAMGQTVWQRTVVAENGNIQQQINTGNLSKGIYLLQVSTGKGSALQKVVIE